MSLIKKLRSALLLSSAIVFSGVAFVSAEGASSGAKQSLEAYAAVSGAQVSAELPVPVMQEVVNEEPALLEKSKGNPCTPSADIAPGKGFSPVIEDQVRITAITQLLGKISVCSALPYSQDGVTNNNLEGGMPQAPKGYYKEYTLIVPGRQTGDGAVPVVIGGKTYMTGTMQSKRGPERIIIGGGKFIYYTMDHYKTFVPLTIVK